MNDDETFTPETIEELIDQHTSSPSSQPTSPQANIIQELQTYYEADQRSAVRMWERLVQHTKLKASANEIEKPTAGESIMQQMPDSIKNRNSEQENQESLGQMGASSTPMPRRISRRTLVAGLGVGAAALGTAASYVFLTGHPQSSSQ
ncbi:MAG TPA: twin-arginine translocation signal domain-containing protein, partial [Ktedonobacteraceae bacterium]|nr:twin-arginine translocation signal domain-containing protein [Ktedonobacteraceae bacterium]